MSSKNIDLDIKESRKKHEFSFTWSIHNYNFCTMKEDKCFESPEFLVDFMVGVRWFLCLYPKGDFAPGFVSCYLNSSTNVSGCNFTLSIRKANGQFKEKENLTYDECLDENGFSEFVSCDELNGPEGYLTNGTLTIQCRIYKADAGIPLSVKCYALSRIKVSKLNYEWTLKDIEVSNQTFNKVIDITYCFGQIPNLKMRVINGGFFDEDAIHFGLEIGKRNSFHFFVCIIHLLDAEGKAVHSERADHLFEQSELTEKWNFPIISKDKLYLNKNLYLSKGKLNLRCEISFSSDNKLETMNYQRTYNAKAKPDLLERSLDGEELWIERMKSCLVDGKFSDFIIRTTDKQFNVHKAILGTHSEVFSAMFEKDWKECESGEVKIKDLETDTVSQMLTFLYTNTIDNLDCTSAQKLYFAADKCDIKSLRKKCSNHLMRCLAVSNVCDILVLADTHHDQELKHRARDFIDAHSQEIIVSEGWKKLLETNTQLTSEVLQSLFCKKFLSI